MMEPTEKGHSRGASVGRTSKKRLKPLLEDFPAITCILAAPFPGIFWQPAPEVTVAEVVAASVTSALWERLSPPQVWLCLSDRDGWPSINYLLQSRA